MSAFGIKVREKGRLRFSFLTRNGTNSLRIHASRFSTREAAQKLIDENAADNPGWEWKIVPLT